MRTDAVLELMTEVAKRYVRPRFRSLASHEIMEKSPGDLVTVADREAEVAITAALQADDPGVLVVGEEAVAADPGLLTQLAQADHAWVVDPIDGTRNFVRGSVDYAVMVAEIGGGEVQRGWILQPEHGVAYSARRGHGLWSSGRPVCGVLAPGDGPWRGRAARLAQRGHTETFDIGASAWCCGVDYPDLAMGRTDFLIYTRSMPWDHAPGSLFVTERGGVVRGSDGGDYCPVEARGGILAAAHPRIWDTVADGLARLRSA